MLHATRLANQNKRITCKKEFTNATVFEQHKTGKKHLKATKEGAINSKSVDVGKTRIMYEQLIKGYLTELAFTREETKAFIDTKQLLTEKERVNIIIKNK